MKHYILNLESYSEETAERIIQNIRFWCVNFDQRTNSAVAMTIHSCRKNSMHSSSVNPSG